MMIIKRFFGLFLHKNLSSECSLELSCPMITHNIGFYEEITLRLHYVPGDHGSHGSPKCSAPCDLVNFCLGTQALLSIITFRHGLSRYPLQTVGLTPGDTTVLYV